MSMSIFVYIFRIQDPASSIQDPGCGRCCRLGPWVGNLYSSGFLVDLLVTFEFFFSLRLPSIFWNTLVFAGECVFGIISLPAASRCNEIWLQNTYSIELNFASANGKSCSVNLIRHGIYANIWQTLASKSQCRLKHVILIGIMQISAH